MLLGIIEIAPKFTKLLARVLDHVHLRHFRAEEVIWIVTQSSDLVL